MGAVVRERAREQPDRRIVRFADAAVTYGELDARSDRVAAALAAAGMQHGDRAAVLLPNGVQFLDTWVGMAKLGMVEVPLHTSLRGDPLRHALRLSGCRLAVVDAPLVERVAAAADGLPDLRTLVVVGDGPAGDAGDLEVVGFDDFVASGPPNPPDVDVSTYDRSAILFTSGTTGPSKGVVLTHSANVRLARSVSGAAGLRAGDVLFTTFPLFHVAARYVSTLAAMLIDAEVVIRQKFSASRFWEDCAAEGVTAIHYLGSLLTILLKQPEKPGDRDHAVHTAYGAGAPLPIAEAFEARFGLRLFELYGMTETGMVTMNREGAYKPGSCGTILDDCEVEIHDDDDHPLAPGEVGEIVARPSLPHIMIEEYVGMPEETLAAFRNLWFHTGDLGTFDEDGYLHFVGRKKDAIRRRGENVSAFEVETVLEDHPAVAEVAVIGVPDDISGEEVLALIVARSEIDPVALLDHCQARLPYYAVPRYVRFVETLPRNLSQRVEKHALRAEGVTAETWDREQHGYQLVR